MTHTKTAMHMMMATAATLVLSGAAISAAHAEKAMEKCYGVVKAGQNGCASADGSHSCAAQAKTDGSGQEWIHLPAGACEKIVNGSTKPF